MTAEKLDEIAYRLDRVLKHLDAMVPELAEAVTEGLVPAYVASAALQKLRHGRIRLLECVDNQSRPQLEARLDELRAERRK